MSHNNTSCDVYFGHHDAVQWISEIGVSHIEPPQNIAYSCPKDQRR